MVLLFRLENRDLVLWTPSEMHHFRIFIFLTVVFLRRRADRLGGAGGGGGGGRGSLGGLDVGSERGRRVSWSPSSTVCPTLPQFPATLCRRSLKQQAPPSTRLRSS